MSLMSLFEKYAYRRREKVAIRNSNGAQDGLTHWNGSMIPNRAHPPAVTRVSETPESLLPKTPLEGEASPRSRKGRCKGRQKRRARILSSSEEEEEVGPDTPPAASTLTPVKIHSLFSELPLSKRRKVDLPKEVKKCKVDLPVEAKRSTLVRTSPVTARGERARGRCLLHIITPCCIHRGCVPCSKEARQKGRYRSEL